MKSIYSIIATSGMLCFAVVAKPVMHSANNATTSLVEMYGHNPLQRRSGIICNPTTNGWSPISDPTDVIASLEWISQQKDAVCSPAPMAPGGPDPCHSDKGLTCYNGVKIVVCNQTPDWVSTAKCSTVVDYVNAIYNQCMVKGKGFFGQMFDDGGWNVYLTADDIHCKKAGW